MGSAFILLTLSMTTYIFVGWLPLTQCSVELYSLLVLVKRAFFVNALYMVAMEPQLQAVMVLVSVMVSCLINYSRVKSQKLCTLLSILLGACTASYSHFLTWRAQREVWSALPPPFLPLLLLVTLPSSLRPAMAIWASTRRWTPGGRTSTDGQSEQASLSYFTGGRGSCAAPLR